MDNAIGNILNFFTDAGKSIGAKAATIIFSLFLLFSFDLLSDFTYNIQMNNKLNQLDKICELKQVFANSPERMTQLNQLEDQVMNKLHYSIRFSSIFKSEEKPISDIETVTPKNKTPKKRQLNVYWMIISSNYFTIALIFISLYLVVFDYQDLGKTGIAGVLTVCVVLGFAGLIITAIAYQIPILNSSKIFWNYILNAGIHFLFAFPLIIMASSKKH